MNMMRVSWGMSALVWFGFVVLWCVALGWPAVGIAMLFAILPDVPLIDGFAERGRLKAERVRLYNTLHSMPVPLAMLALGAVAFFITGGLNDGFWPLALAGAVWFVHIAADRAFGYGFRDADGGIIPVGGPFG